MTKYFPIKSFLILCFNLNMIFNNNKKYLAIRDINSNILLLVYKKRTMLINIALNIIYHFNTIGCIQCNLKQKKL